MRGRTVPTSLCGEPTNPNEGYRVYIPIFYTLLSFSPFSPGIYGDGAAYPCIFTAHLIGMSLYSRDKPSKP